MALICAVAAMAIYWTLIRKKRRESAEWVPAALVRAYLDRVRTDEADIRYRLFGEQSTPVLGHVHAPTSTNAADPAAARELEALRAQLSLADQRALDFDRMLNGLRAEKSALEQKIATTPAPVAGAPGAPPAAMVKELEDLKAKLQEYEVIEDDLANLKKFQKENEALRVKIDGYEKGGSTVVAGSAPAAPVEVKISGGAPQQPAELKIVSGGNATPAETPKAPETNTNVLEPIIPSIDSVVPGASVVAAPAAPAAAATAAPAPADAAAPAAAAEKSPKEKEAELLSEFEKMLAS
ncbi:MAG: hypothetical protein ACXVBE_03905 [Bdellovibrionota bacterium]